MTEFSAWAVNTSDGIIIIDALYDYSVDDEIAEGLKKVGLDPARIKYIVISHGHSDHSGGAKYLQDSYKAHVLLSAPTGICSTAAAAPSRRATWSPPTGRARRSATRRSRCTVTPGHTPGTLSYLIPVKDNGTPHLVAEWGGTAFNFPRTVDNFKAYTASAVRFGEIAARAGADMLIFEPFGVRRLEDENPRAQAAQARRAEPVHGRQRLVARYMKIAEECSRAAEVARRTVRFQT